MSSREPAVLLGMTWDFCRGGEGKQSPGLQCQLSVDTSMLSGLGLFDHQVWGLDRSSFKQVEE